MPESFQIGTRMGESDVNPVQQPESRRTIDRGTSLLKHHRVSAADATRLDGRHSYSGNCYNLHICIWKTCFTFNYPLNYIVKIRIQTVYFRYIPTIVLSVSDPHYLQQITWIFFINSVTSQNIAVIQIFINTHNFVWYYLVMKNVIIIIWVFSLDFIINVISIKFY